jgi:hypothetical protein
LILTCSLLLDDFSPGGGREVVKGGKGVENLHNGERSLRGEFDASLKWETKLTILAQALFGPPILALSSLGFTCD